MFAHNITLTHLTVSYLRDTAHICAHMQEYNNLALYIRFVNVRTVPCFLFSLLFFLSYEFPFCLTFINSVFRAKSISRYFNFQRWQSIFRLFTSSDREQEEGLIRMSFSREFNFTFFYNSGSQTIYDLLLGGP